MKAIELDLMKEYRYLSNLYSAKGGLYYTETIADIANNDYVQYLHRLEPEGKKDCVVYGPQKRIASFVLNDDVVIRKSTEGETVGTLY
ncbi:MAG: hypothetical protein II004_04090, partial [Erysipelotrichaceae bacterium]|nr:hypothetical protein [Erysipelotrichaceae bacterium]